MQMATLEQMNNMIQQMSKQSVSVVNNSDAKDVLSLPIVQKVILAYEDELKLKKSVNNCSCGELIPTILEKLNNHSLKLQLIENKLNDLFTLFESKESKQEEFLTDKNQTKLTSFPGFGQSPLSEAIMTSISVQEDYLRAQSLDLHCLESQQQESLESQQQESLESQQQESLESHCLEKENITLNIEETEPENNNIDIIENFDDEDIDNSTDTETDVVDQVQTEAVEEEDEEAAEDAVAIEDEEREEEDEEAAEDAVAIEDEEREEEDEEAVAIEDEEVVEEDESDENVSTEEEVATEDDEEDVEVEKTVEDVEVEEEEEDSEEVFEIEIDDVTYFATDEENGILYEVDKDGEVGKKVGIIKDGEPIFS
jgi:hypothetical protein